MLAGVILAVIGILLFVKGFAIVLFSKPVRSFTGIFLKSDDRMRLTGIIMLVVGIILAIIGFSIGLY
ncbi:MAG TPA: hypothetical protein VJK51_01830 [Candidatus Nanoarchaeia archaeon]|nr:hypothetical protein [Candidatus Nanoarchaeia archaeon]